MKRQFAATKEENWGRKTKRKSFFIRVNTHHVPQETLRTFGSPVLGEKIQSAALNRSDFLCFCQLCPPGMLPEGQEWGSSCAGAVHPGMMLALGELSHGEATPSGQVGNSALL